MTFSIRTYDFHTFPIAPINNQSVSGRTSQFIIARKSLAYLKYIGKLFYAEAVESQSHPYKLSTKKDGCYQSIGCRIKSLCLKLFTLCRIQFELPGVSDKKLTFY